MKQLVLGTAKPTQTEIFREDPTIDLAISRSSYGNDFFDVISAEKFVEFIPTVIFLGEPPSRRYCLVEFFNEIYRILAPGGQFEFIVPFYPHYSAFQDPRTASIWTEYSVYHYCNKYEGKYWEMGHKTNFKLISASKDSRILEDEVGELNFVPYRQKFVLEAIKES